MAELRFSEDATRSKLRHLHLRAVLELSLPRLCVLHDLVCIEITSPHGSLGRKARQLRRTGWHQSGLPAEPPGSCIEMERRKGGCQRYTSDMTVTVWKIGQDSSRAWPVQ